MQGLQEGQTKEIELKFKKRQNRRLTATTSGYVTTEPHHPESHYQSWEMVKKGSSFTLKNKGNGTYLAYSHNAVRLETNPYEWASDEKLSHVASKDDNSRVLAVADDDPRHVLLKEFKPENEAHRSKWPRIMKARIRVHRRIQKQRLQYIFAAEPDALLGSRTCYPPFWVSFHASALQSLQEGQPKQLELTCVKHKDRRLSATASGNVTTEPHIAGSPSQSWEMVKKDSSFTLKNKTTGTYLAYSHNAIRLEKDPYYWAYDEEMSQIYPKDDNYRALAVALQDPRKLQLKDYQLEDETQKWEWSH